MAAKKKTLRSKISAKNSKEQTSQDEQTSIEPIDENPFLRLNKTTKKEKQLAKSSSLKEKVLSINTSSSISKSSLRRRKRQAKNELKPKMEELLTSLTDGLEDSKTTRIINNTATFIPPSNKNKNQPNALKKTGQKKIMEMEASKFSQVLNNKEFKANPFKTLQETIRARLQNQ